jgi:molybdopterin-containing oxidoreductase family membrane subunit
MPDKLHVLGLFRDEAGAVAAVEALARSPWPVADIQTPFFSHALADALKMKKSRVGYFTLIGGIIGFLFGIFITAVTGFGWGLMVGGKPVVALIPSVIVGFEFTILFSIFGNVIGFLSQARLPRIGDLERYDPRCSGDRFGIVASCDETREEELAGLFRKEGGEVRVFR